MRFPARRSLRRPRGSCRARARKILDWFDQYRNGIQANTDNARFRCLQSLVESFKTDSLAPIDRVLEHFPECTEALVLRGFASQPSTKKIAYLERAIRTGPECAVALSLLAAEYNDVGRKRESTTLLLRLVTCSPDLADGHFLPGHLLLEEGQDAAAAHHLQRAVQLAKDTEASRRAQKILARRLKGVHPIPVGNQEGFQQATGVGAVPQDAVTEEPSGRTLSRRAILAISVASVFLIGGPLAQQAGANAAVLGIMVGIAVFVGLSVAFGSKRG